LRISSSESACHSFSPEVFHKSYPESLNNTFARWFLLTVYQTKLSGKALKTGGFFTFLLRFPEYLPLLEPLTTNYEYFIVELISRVATFSLSQPYPHQFISNTALHSTAWPSFLSFRSSVRPEPPMSSLPRGILGSAHLLPDARSFSPPLVCPRTPTKPVFDGHSPLAKPVLVVPKPVWRTTFGKARLLSGLAPLPPMNSPLVPENAEKTAVLDPSDDPPPDQPDPPASVPCL
jgi:hypothetical protein